jgi:ribonucleoside-triphosphate reductase
VGYSEDVFSALDVQDELQTLYTSGTVFHAFLGEKLPDWKAAATLVRKIAENYKLPYYTMSPTYSVCKNHGYLTGEVYTCPHCGEKTEVYSRITGYYRPVQNWNDGKAQEFKDRKVYNIGHSHLSHTGPLHAETIPAPVSAQPEAAQANDIPAAEEKKPVSRAMLFVSATCPNCRLAKTLLQKDGFVYKEVLATENVDLANKYGVRQAPTLVVMEGSEYTKYKGVSEIKSMLTARKDSGEKQAM